MRSKLICSAAIALFFIALSCFISPVSAGPLDNWHVRAPSLTSQYLLGIAYGNGLFVAVGSGGTIITSPDGVDWTVRDSGVTDFLFTITHGNGIFVAGAVHDNGGTNYKSYVLTSHDGITWTLSWLDYPMRVRSIAFGNGKFIASGEKGIATSGDGVRWSYSNESDYFNFMTFGAGKFLTVNGSWAGWSVDGVTWNDNNFSLIDNKGDNFTGMAYGHGNFVAIGGSGCPGVGIPCSRHLLSTSPDMVHWTDRSDSVIHSLGSPLMAIGYGLGYFAAVGGTIEVSHDGINWNQKHAARLFLGAITNDDRTFVAVGGNGLILQSDPVLKENTVVDVPTVNKWGILLFALFAWLGASIFLHKQKKLL